MNLQLIREFRLSPFGTGRGVSCDANGAFVDSVPLLKRTRANGQEIWAPRDCDELSAGLGEHFGLPIDVSSKSAGLSAIARALNAGAVAHAQLVTLHLEIPNPPTLTKSVSPHGDVIRFIRELWLSGLIKTWEPDKHPRWPAGTPDSAGGQFAPKGEDVPAWEYPGFAQDANDVGTGSYLDIAANTPRKKTSTVIRAWEKAEDKIWPKDPKTGRNQVAAHIRALADGGDNEPGNIRPMPHDEHVADHKEKGDFARWAKRRGSGSGGLPPSKPPPSSPKPGSKPPPKGPVSPPQQEPLTEEDVLEDLHELAPFIEEE